MSKKTIHVTMKFLPFLKIRPLKLLIYFLSFCLIAYIFFANFTSVFKKWKVGEEVDVEITSSKTWHAATIIADSGNNSYQIRFLDPHIAELKGDIVVNSSQIRDPYEYWTKQKNYPNYLPKTDFQPKPVIVPPKMRNLPH